MTALCARCPHSPATCGCHEWRLQAPRDKYDTTKRTVHVCTLPVKRRQLERLADAIIKEAMKA